MTRLMLLLIALISPNAAWAQEGTDWSYFRASGGWRIEQGRALIQLSGSEARGELYAAHHPSVLRISFKGTWGESKVEIRRIVEGTDLGESTLLGIVRRACPEDDLDGREWVVLTDGIEVIGFSRPVPIGTPCKPAA